MKKLMFLLSMLILMITSVAFSQVPAWKIGQKVSVSGTIKSAEFEGNNFLYITLNLAGKNNDITVECTGKRTTAYASGKEIYWTDLKAGRKIKVTGEWINQNGKKLIWATRIDVLK
jgi:hypothetical protein